MTLNATVLATDALAAVPRKRVPIQKTAQVTTPIIDANKNKQIVYCVALEPGMVDDHGDVMDCDEIDYTAHRFLRKSRIIKSQHRNAMRAEPVESFVAPVDLTYDSGMYGEQKVKKGSWVIGIQVHDKAEWEKIKTGEYTGVSVGGFGNREEWLP